MTVRIFYRAILVFVFVDQVLSTSQRERKKSKSRILFNSFGNSGNGNFYSCSCERKPRSKTEGVVAKHDDTMMRKMCRNDDISKENFDHGVGKISDKAEIGSSVAEKIDTATQSADKNLANAQIESDTANQSIPPSEDLIESASQTSALNDESDASKAKIPQDAELKDIVDGGKTSETAVEQTDPKDAEQIQGHENDTRGADILKDNDDKSEKTSETGVEQTDPKDKEQIQSHENEARSADILKDNDDKSEKTSETGVEQTDPKDAEQIKNQSETNNVISATKNRKDSLPKRIFNKTIVKPFNFVAKKIYKVVTGRNPQKNQ
ncbi:hypothetical protein EDEG_03100 [Edhazardia aedis USNM 41457]|uniref:Uncharacterized protein n=1 Tax=Edhazardia aedis (strain USNM 41457) TaxID=1003232 RepID=J9DIP2_EDHAE|nr:hypothetical protein EDEG_03100 [Edhazardia aedis USNM 41457]|eukprot:EJW02480.1 hypothetical protein EDEG_03100 [Edhazardia aedis USNM 41457]